MFIRCALVTVLLFAVPVVSAAQQPSRGPAYHNGEFNVREFGAAGTGAVLDTDAIQRAIRAASLAGGGKVVFEPGVYLTGTFELLSNVTLDIEAGAVLRGSTRVSDYRPIGDFGFARNYGVDSTGEGVRLGIIVARNAENLGIIGRGTIDGNSEVFIDAQKPHYSMDFDPHATRQGQGFMNAVLATGDGPIEFGPDGRPGTMIVFLNCRNILMRDVTLRHSPNWTVHFQTVRQAVVDGVHVNNDLRVPNNDGFDCMACRDVRYSNLDIKTGDDDFAIVGSEDITVANCSMASNSSTIRLEDTRASVFSNLSIHANRGIGIYERGGGRTADVIFSNLVIDTFLLTGHWWGKGEPIYVAIGETGGTAGIVRSVRFSNVSGQAENGIVLYGDPRGNIENIAFDHVTLQFRVTRADVNAAVGGNFDLRWTAGSPANSIFRHDSPGLYARYVDGLTIDGLDLTWAGAMPDYYSSAMQIEDARNVDVNRFRGRQAALQSKTPVVALARVEGVSIRNSAATEGATTFVSMDHVTGQKLFVENDLSRAQRSFNVAPRFTLSGNLLPGGKETRTGAAQ
jgi:polygalacturonase